MKEALNDTIGDLRMKTLILRHTSINHLTELMVLAVAQNTNQIQLYYVHERL